MQKENLPGERRWKQQQKNFFTKNTNDYKIQITGMNQ